MSYSDREQRILMSIERAARSHLAEVASRLDALGEAGLTTAGKALRLMTSLYEESPVPDCDREHDGDMLLAQWGVHELNGPATFMFDVTRQYIATAVEDSPILQLQLTFHYPVAGLSEISSGSTWSQEHQNLQAFLTFVEQSPAFLAVRARAPINIDLALEQV